MSCGSTGSGLGSGLGLTHPILTDIEDISALTKTIFEKECVSFKDGNAKSFIDFVKDLCYEDSGRSSAGIVEDIPVINGKLINYIVRQDYEKRTTSLRKRYKNQPK